MNALLAFWAERRYSEEKMGDVTSVKGGEFFELGELARGGMGTTHLMVRRDDVRSFCVFKRMSRGLRKDGEAVRRFRHEAVLSQRVFHPHVVRTLGSGEDEQGPFLVLEYVHGTHLLDLSDRAQLKRRLLSVRCVAAAGAQVVEGLNALHQARDEQDGHLRILHRDISPNNLLVEDTGRVLLSDFGISKSRLSTVSTEASHLLGKIAYLAPEYLGSSISSTAGDVYSLGVSLWVLLVGRLPFHGRSETQIIQAILTDGVPPIRLLRADVPESLAELLAAMTAMEPERRPRPDEILEVLRGSSSQGTPFTSPCDVVQAEVDRLAGSDLAIKRQVFTSRAQQLHSQSRGN